MFRIGLAYINGSNLGDVIIYETARYLVEKVLMELKVEEYKIIPIDIGSFHAREYPYTIFQKFKATQAYRTYLRLKEQHGCEKKLEKILLRKWHSSREYLYFSKREQTKLEDLDFLIFAGGGLIKYHQQNFYYYLDEITRFADKKGFPILLNAVGVEGYDEEDPRCRLLKQALNRDCVKYISTRDDLETLSCHYITNSQIQVEAVCDPALWTPECYQIQPQTDSLKIGLGVIRPKIFKEYMYYVNKERLTDMYFALAKRLTQSGYQVEFFSNGVDKDDQFIRHILSNYPSLTTVFHVTTNRPKTPADLVRTIASYDRFLAVRLHASIIGCSMGIPNLNLVWDIKQLLFGQEMGLRECYVTKENFDDEILFERLLKLKKPKMDFSYKQTICNGLFNQISKIVKGIKHDS